MVLRKHKMVMDFGVCFSIIFSCLALTSAKSITRFDLSKHHGGSLENAIQQDTIFVAHRDSLYNVNPYTGDVRWSFSSGEPLLSSFQDGKTNSSLNYNYVDIEDSTFVVRGSDGKVKYKFTDAADQLLSKFNSAPNILAEQIVVGTKRTEIHILDANSGRLHTSAASTTKDGNANDESSVESDVVETGRKICVVRITYCFQSFPVSGETKWSLNYSEYRVAEHSKVPFAYKEWDAFGKRDTFVPFLLPPKVPSSSDHVMQHELPLPGTNTDMKGF